jgi:hypothetical protein
MAALAEAPPLVTTEDAAGWTEDEVETCAGLLDAIDADAAHWRAGDWLLRKEPMAADGSARTGSHARLDELARRIGRTGSFLRQLRLVSHAWPVQTRPAFASWHVCRVFTSGGPQEAQRRLQELELIPRGAKGRVTVETLTAWRELQRHTEHGDKIRAAAERSRSARVAPDVVALLRRCDDLLGDADKLLLNETLPSEIRTALDGLVASLEVLGQALAGNHAARPPLPDRPT